MTLRGASGATGRLPRPASPVRESVQILGGAFLLPALSRVRPDGLTENDEEEKEMKRLLTTVSLFATLACYGLYAQA